MSNSNDNISYCDKYINYSNRELKQHVKQKGLI